MGKKLKQRERIQLQQEMDAVNGIVSEIEIKNRVEPEVYWNVISPMQCIYSTSDYLIKIARNASEHKEQIKIWRMHLFAYEDRIIYGYLPKNSVDTANDAYHAGQKRSLKLTDYQYTAVRCHFNSFGLIEWHGEQPLSSYEPVNPYTKLSEEAGKLLVDEITCLAKRGFWIPSKALYYCPETQDVKLFDYFFVEYLGIPEEEKIKDYLDSYRTLYM